MRVLVTNDDGFDAPGLAALAGAVVEAGHEAVVVAPLTDHSGAGASLVVEAGRDIAVRRTRIDALPAVDVIGIDGSPALAVLLARLGAFGKPPNLVVSGINAGANTGRGILHSGTVGAALTAATMGMSGLAVSMAAAEPVNWTTGARVAGVALGWLVGAQRRTVLNVNVPDLPLSRVEGVRWGRIAAFGASSLIVNVRDDDRIELGAAASRLPLDPETDAVLVRDGFVSVTSLVGLTAVADPAAAADIDSALAAWRPAAGRATVDAGSGGPR